MKNTNIPENIFRAYDIRGKAELLAEVAEIIGRAVGTYFVVGGGKKLIVGRDNRQSSSRIKDSFVNGLLMAGCDVIDIGLSTSPLLYYKVIKLEADGGINITGSHLPPTENGFKVVGKGAYPIATQEIKKIQEIALNLSFESGDGNYERHTAVDDYYDHIKNPINLKRPVKIVIDCGNAVTGLFAPTVFRNLGCEVVELYCELNDEFPNHLPDPEKEENVADLKKKVLETGAEIGLAFDGDGDRLGIIDENGVYRETDYILILLARDFLDRHPSERILFDVKSSQNVIDEIQAAGGVPVLWKTGHSLIKQKMRDDGILLGAEFSGHIFAFEDYYPFDDALYAASKVLSVVSNSNKPLSSNWTKLKKRFPTHLIELPCSDEKKFEAVQSIVDQMSKKYEVITIDGARILFEHGWAVIRASNTSANLTVRFEADEKHHLVEIIKQIESLLGNYEEVDTKKLRELLKGIH